LQGQVVVRDAIAPINRKALQPDSFLEFGISACCDLSRSRIRLRRSFSLNDRPQTFRAKAILIFIDGGNLRQFFTPALLFCLSATGKSNAAV
jgi:hypothetical protein